MGSMKPFGKMVIVTAFFLLVVIFRANGEVAQNNAQSLECTPEGRPKVPLLIHSQNLKLLSPALRKHCNVQCIEYLLSSLLSRYQSPNIYCIPLAAILRRCIRWVITAPNILRLQNWHFWSCYELFWHPLNFFSKQV